jgi:predicted nucleotidyltransferase
MNEYEALLTKAKEIVNPLKKRLFFLGIVTKALEEKGVKPVIVGGCALEFYSTGGYATGDIDIIYYDVEILGKKLETWGFRKEGRHWIHEELDIFIEVPGSCLSVDEKKRITLVEIEGLKVYLIGIEDLIIDRLNAFVHWKSTDDGYWAKELLFIYREKLDMEYLQKRCLEEKTSESLIILIQEVNELEKN